MQIISIYASSVTEEKSKKIVTSIFFHDSRYFSVFLNIESVSISIIRPTSGKKSKGRIARHTAVNGVIKRALLSAKIPSHLEPAKLSHCDNKRPDGNTTMPWSRGQSMAWDLITCPDTLAASHLKVAVTGPGQLVANHAEHLKIVKYAALSKESQFIPIAIETLGPVGEEATHFLQELGRRIEAVTRDSRSTSFFLAAFECGSAKRKCSVCVRHITLGGGGHFGPLKNSAYVTVLNYYQWNCTMFIVVDSGLIVIT